MEIINNVIFSQTSHSSVVAFYPLLASTPCIFCKSFYIRKGQEKENTPSWVYKERTSVCQNYAGTFECKVKQILKDGVKIGVRKKPTGYILLGLSLQFVR